MGYGQAPEWRSRQETQTDKPCTSRMRTRCLWGIAFLRWDSVLLPYLVIVHAGLGSLLNAGYMMWSELL